MPLPYVPPPTFALGAYTVSAYGGLAALSLPAALAALHWRAKKHGFIPEEAAAAAIPIALAALLGAHAFSILTSEPQRLLNDPGLLLNVSDGLSSFGGLAGGLLAWLAVSKHQSWILRQQLDFLDVLAWAVVIQLLVIRLGCALAHDHIGVASNAWFAVDFPTGARIDLGLMEWLALWPMLGVLIVMDRLRAGSGVYAALCAMLYGLLRLCLQLGGGDPQDQEATALATQVPALVTMCFGAGLLVIAVRMHRNSR